MIIVGGRGPVKARVMLIGEAPGADEAAAGRPFVGRSGKEQDRYLTNGGLNPYTIRMDNLVPEYREGNPDPTSEQISYWGPKLLERIAITSPQFIITVGRFATRYLLGDDADMEVVHGLPCQSPLAHSATIIPCYHPAGGFYDDEARPIIAYDYWRAGQICAGRIPAEPVLDAWPDPTYVDVDCPFDGWSGGVLAIDTEGIPGEEWSFQVSQEEGTGLVFRRSDRYFAHNVQVLKRYIETHDPLIVVHNYMYDAEMMIGFDLDISGYRIFDTRYAAYILRVEPQALKVLAARHCGMRMQDYADVVGPIGLEKQLSYLGRILEVGRWPKPEARVERSNDGTARLYTPQPVERRAEAILGDYYSEKLDKEGRRCDPHKRWKQVDRQLRRMVEEQLGPMPIGTLADIPLDSAIWYAGRDPDATLRLYHRLLPVLEAKRISALMEDGNQVLPVFEEMQRNGMRANRTYMAEHWEKMDARMSQLQSFISANFYGGKPFNPNSAPQVAMMMRRRGLEGEKRSKKTHKVSTGKKSIEHLRFEDPFIGATIDWREHAKMRDSFYGPIMERLDDMEVEVGRIRTHINPYKVVSRRIASSDPNLTAVPVRNELGAEVRNGFDAEEGCELGSWDLSQVEMRYMAHVSADPLLCQFFHENRDIHAETASRIFGIGLSGVKEMEHRYPAKRAAFGIITNIQGQGLYDQLRMAGCKGWSVDRCDELITEFLKVYVGVAEFMEASQREAHQRGYVRDVWGMERPLPGVYSTDDRVVAEAERAASSMKIQGGAQGMIQKSMIWLKPYIRGLAQAGVTCKWILQIHDEIILEFSEDLWETLNPLVIEALTEHSMKLRVPVKAKGSHAKTWGKLKA